MTIENDRNMEIKEGHTDYTNMEIKHGLQTTEIWRLYMNYSLRKHVKIEWKFGAKKKFHKLSCFDEFTQGYDE